MKHDQLCERLLSTNSAGGCKCASRAYKADPLPDAPMPIYAELKLQPSGRMISSAWGYTGS